MAERIDLNLARTRDIAAVPGVDRLQARSIVRDRKRFGPFQSMNDVRRVRGVSEKLVAMLEERFTVRRVERRDDEVMLRFEDGKPFYFAGPPRQVGGLIGIENVGDETARAVVLRIECAELRTAEGEPLRGVRLRISLGPGERRRLEIRLRLHDTTPPGTYQAFVAVGEHRHPVVIAVAEYTATALLPAPVTLPTLPNKYERKITVRNNGNIPITVGDIGAVQLEDDNLQCRVIRETIHKTPHNPTLDQLVGTAADVLKKDFASVPPLRVRTKNKPVHVEPGGDALLDLEITVPTKLRHDISYSATAVVFDTRLTFELIPGIHA